LNENIDVQLGGTNSKADIKVNGTNDKETTVYITSPALSHLAERGAHVSTPHTLMIFTIPTI
jgi:hypothetical protein